MEAKTDPTPSSILVQRFVYGNQGELRDEGVIERRLTHRKMPTVQWGCSARITTVEVTTVEVEGIDFVVTDDPMRTPRFTINLAKDDPVVRDLCCPTCKRKYG